MCRAIAEAYDVDEVNQIRDKAVAMEAYFRQAKDPEPERRCCEIRLRAEKKAGASDKKLGRAQGRKSDLTSGDAAQKSHEEILANAGVSVDQSSSWQQLARVPEEDFEMSKKLDMEIVGLIEESIPLGPMTIHNVFTVPNQAP